MKVGSRCGYCLLHRGYKIINLSTEDEDTRLKAMQELLKLFGEHFTPDTVPSILGAERERIIAEITGCNDPYADEKRKANSNALNMLPSLRKIIDECPSGERLRKASLISCLGNVLDYDLPGVNTDLNQTYDSLKDGFYIDDTEKFKSLINKGTEILFFTDNAGEIAFDTLLVEELKQLGCRVVVAVKDGPSLNDALIEDAKIVGMVEIADEIITTGVQAIGVRLDKAPGWFKDRFNSAELIIAKGMANWETLSEIPAPSPLLFLFRTKCEPIARSVSAPKNQSIALLVEKGWSL